MFRSKPRAGGQLRRYWSNDPDESPQIVSLCTQRCARLGGRCFGFGSLEFPFSNCAACRESVSSQATGVLSGAPDPPMAADERGSALVGLLVTLLCLEIGSPPCYLSNRDMRQGPGKVHPPVPDHSGLRVIALPRSNHRAETSESHVLYRDIEISITP